MLPSLPAVVYARVALDWDPWRASIQGSWSYSTQFFGGMKLEARIYTVIYLYSPILAMNFQFFFLEK